MEDDPLGTHQKAFFRKLVQLQNLAEEFTYAIANLGYRRSVLESACESTCLSLSGDAFHNLSTLLALVEADHQSICDRYGALYRSKVKSLDSKLRMNFQTRADQIALCEKSAREAAEEIIETIRQLGHSVGTAANAIDAQSKGTMREIDAGVRSLRMMFESSVRQHDQESLEKNQLFEQQTETRMNDLRRAHQKKLDQCQGRKLTNRKTHVTRDRASSLLSELAQMRDTVLSILQADRARFEEHRELVRSMTDMLREQKDILKKDDGIYVSFKQLDRDLSKEIRELKGRLNRLEKETQQKLVAMQSILETDRLDHKQALEQRGTEVIRMSREAHAGLTELLMVKANELRVVQDGNRKAQDVVQAGLRQNKLDMGKAQQDMAYELIRLRDEHEAAMADCDAQITYLKSSYEAEKVDLRKAQEGNLANVGGLARRLIQTISSQKADFERLQDELTALKRVGETNRLIDLPAYNTTDLRRQLDAQYEAECAKQRQKLTDHQDAYKFALSARKQELAASATAALAEQPTECAFAQKIEWEYEAVYEAERQKLAKIAVETRGFSKSDRLIENLRHRQFQLKSGVKFQRVAVDSEWRLKIDQENARFEEASIEFARSFERLQLLFDSQAAVDEARGEAARELIDLENELSVLVRRNDEIHRRVAADKDGADQGGELRKCLEESKAESERRIDNSKGSVEAQCGQFRQLIADVESETGREKASLIGATQKLGGIYLDSQNTLKERQTITLKKIEEETAAEAQRIVNAKQAQKCEFEAAQHNLEAHASEIGERIKTGEAKNAEQFKMNLSERRMALEDLAKDCQAALDGLTGRRDSMIDFWNERVDAAVQQRNKMKELFAQHGPRPAEQEQMDALQASAETVIAQWTDAAGALLDVKRQLVRQEKRVNHRFEKRPKVAKVRVNTLAVV